MNSKLFNKLKHEFEGLKFLYRNMQASHSIHPIPEVQLGGYSLCGLPQKYVGIMDELHRALRDNRPINFWRKLLLKHRGQAICGIAINNGALLGFCLYYFREDELSSHIIHEAFIGVEPNSRNKGIATSLRYHMAKHFAMQGLKGISTQISPDNLPSLRSAKRIGFRCVDNTAVQAGVLKLFLDLSGFDRTSNSLSKTKESRKNVQR